LCAQLLTYKILQSLDIRKVTNSSFKYQVFENLGKYELGPGPLVSHGLTGHYVHTRGHVAMARPLPATSRNAVGRPLPPAVYARASPCCPYPFPCRAGRSKLTVLHRELLIHHLTP
jgi:hypothetical protein